MDHVDRNFLFVDTATSCQIDKLLLGTSDSCTKRMNHSSLMMDCSLKRSGTLYLVGILFLISIFFQTTNASTNLVNKKTVVSVAKNLIFDQKTSTKFNLEYPFTDNDRLKNIYSKLVGKSVTMKSSKARVTWAKESLLVSIRSWLLFQKKYQFDRHDIIKNNSFSIVFETSSLKSNNPSKTSLIVITCEIVEVDDIEKLQIDITGSSNGIPKSELKDLIEMIREFMDKELQREIQLLVVRDKQLSRLSSESKVSLEQRRKKKIDQVINPDKYAKPKGRGARLGSESTPSRYTPGAATQARRQVKRG